MKTTEKNYKKRITHFEKVQQSLCDNLSISTDEFRQIEFETGCRLIDEYFFECSHPELARIYSTQLLEDRKHMYWPWFINQKQRVDEAFRKENRYIVIDSKTQIKEYRLELLRWCMSSTIHDRLRHFINQSKTLYL